MAKQPKSDKPNRPSDAFAEAAPANVDNAAPVSEINSIRMTSSVGLTPAAVVGHNRAARSRRNSDHSAPSAQRAAAIAPEGQLAVALLLKVNSNVVRRDFMMIVLGFQGC